MAQDKNASVYFDRDKFRFIGLTDEKIGHLKEAYPNKDVDEELKKMAVWLVSPKGQKRQGNLSFIMNWLNNSPSKSNVSEDSEHDSPLRPFINEYLKELWKDREYLLELNRMTMKKKKN